MKSKFNFKNIFLYSLAIVGAYSLLLSAMNKADDTADVVDALEDIAYEIKTLSNAINNGVYTYPQ